jgi:GNAT superfamily N-acetyltransferase
MAHQAELDHLSVNQQYRRARLGSRLLKEFEQLVLYHLYSFNVKSIALYAPDWNYLNLAPQARNRFYKRHGFKDLYNHHFHDPDLLGLDTECQPNMIKHGLVA